MNCAVKGVPDFVSWGKNMDSKISRPEKGFLYFAFNTEIDLSIYFDYCSLRPMVTTSVAVIGSGHGDPVGMCTIGRICRCNL